MTSRVSSVRASPIHREASPWRLRERSPRSRAGCFVRGDGGREGRGGRQAGTARGGRGAFSRESSRRRRRRMTRFDASDGRGTKETRARFRESSRWRLGVGRMLRDFLSSGAAPRGVRGLRALAQESNACRHPPKPRTRRPGPEREEFVNGRGAVEPRVGGVAGHQTVSMMHRHQKLLASAEVQREVLETLCGAWETSVGGNGEGERAKASTARRSGNAASAQTRSRTFRQPSRSASL